MVLPNVPCNTFPISSLLAKKQSSPPGFFSGKGYKDVAFTHCQELNTIRSRDFLIYKKVFITLTGKKLFFQSYTVLTS